ncbi:MAG: phospho-N-acetylmuramoyl-pentapeptide-transferase [Deltaproteobacteria bacterium RIFCSPLOWO2_12_FULL_43_16]|nr:MAG: phospho-N-acetylmuramoyl-pentapeptide-transferase [Deltaproteobacteria bacterium GWA2_43_19]OGQ10881.1 MAG: phospho-N-acetylmuramoyl-pentapeptide-transferase [Deltaproteobacteria bacterium RIFCSPHIGHO2_02_FULL_43_33]OGQ59974.1 MAG: phospho-N-acetylmuramoyl-pentapeptide-transferase [Deltaproteobacteria bacterium RIFCSPLOWO2_12_FULL_43_16]HBR16097.1 phospho-N-acetylmuramoyl-pentapeptide-transferase [Deltaproteobacteria bacterium]
MLYHLLYPLYKYHTIFNVFQYITFRTIYAVVTALLLSFIIGPYVIKKLSLMQIGQVVRKDGPPQHLSKEGTPTMGGVLILLSIIIPTLLWANLTNPYVWLLIAVTLCLGMVGFVDDYKKVVQKNCKGLLPGYKFLWQFIVASGIALFLYFTGFNTSVAVPFFKNVIIPLGWLYVPFAILVIVGASNAVNLTDGLDGLAVGPIIIAAATYMLFTYLTGNVKIAQYLQIMYVPKAAELTIFAGAMVGASLGFLWFNSYPAQVFMGDVGSLSLGGALGTLAIITKQEILLVLVGGVFVVEALSVIFQVGSFKLRGKRIFKMAPLHHHFELDGWAEPKIIVRFWIISIILSLIAISTLKLR